MQVNASTKCTIRTANGVGNQMAWAWKPVGENPEIPPKCRDRSGCPDCQKRGNGGSNQGNSVLLVEIILGLRTEKLSLLTVKIVVLVNPRSKLATILTVPRTQR